jgi:formylglycine-generating enzyme required for sulfatase activity
MDVAGNVWEWVGTEHKERKDARVLRGGAWANNLSRARCDARLRFNPYFSHDDVGFRVCAPHLF